MSESPTYRVIGGDSEEYGPYSAVEIQNWIQEGRINRESKMSRSDIEGWHAAGAFPELAWPAAGPEPQAPPEAGRPAAAPRPARLSVDQISPASLAGIHGAASWLFWIAGLSVVNVVLAVAGSDFSFALGSLAVQFAAVAGLAAGGKGLGLAFGLLSAGIWVGMGFAARRGHRWAFVTAMLLFSLDTLLLFAFFSIISLVIHLYVLYKLFEGLKQSWILQRALKAGA